MKGSKIIAFTALCMVTLTACNTNPDVQNKSSSVSSEYVSSYVSSKSPSSSAYTSSGNTSMESSNGTSSIQFSSSSLNVSPTENTQFDFENLSNKKMGWGQGYNTDSKNCPVSCTDYNNKYGKYSAVFMAPESNKVYLTFDEGYENGYTGKILDVLKEKKVTAVFFITYDYAKSNADLVKRMVNEGHIIGNHSWSHPSMPEVSTEKAKEEITKLHDYVYKNFGVEMNLFRPPMGEFSEKSLAITQSLNYTSVFWSFAYYDYAVDDQPDKDKAFNRVTQAVHPGAIYLLHAVSKTNTEILGSVIDNIRSQGYEFSALEL